MQESMDTTQMAESLLLNPFRKLYTENFNVKKLKYNIIFVWNWGLQMVCFDNTLKTRKHGCLF